MRSKDALLKDSYEEQERVIDTAKQVRSEIKSGSLNAFSKFQRPQPPASRGPSSKPEQPHASASTSGNPPVITHIKSCKFCGTSHRYDKAYCLSKDAVCRTCNEVGHYAKLCSKKLKSLTYLDDSDPEQFSDGDYYTVCSVSTRSFRRPWRANVQLGRCLVNFKVDSGADVSAISLDDYNTLSSPPKCRPSQAQLVGVAHQPLETVGVFAAEMKYKSVTHKEKIFVIKGLDDHILSRRACDSLEVIEFKGARNLTLPSPPQCLHPILAKPTSSTLRDPKVTFLECFTGLGRMAAEHKITRRNQIHLTNLPEPSERLDDTNISDFSLEGEDMHNGNINLPVEIPGQQADARPAEVHEEVQPQDPPVRPTRSGRHRSRHISVATCKRTSIINNIT
jgi:hypothetical protein